MTQSSNHLIPPRFAAGPAFSARYSEEDQFRPPALTAQAREDVERLRAKVRAHNPGYITSHGRTLPAQLPSVPQLLDELAHNVAAARTDQGIPGTPLPEVEPSELAKAGFDWKAIADKAIEALESGSRRPLPLANDPDADSIPGLSVIAGLQPQVEDVSSDAEPVLGDAVDGSGQGDSDYAPADSLYSAVEPEFAEPVAEVAAQDTAELSAEGSEQPSDVGTPDAVYTVEADSDADESLVDDGAGSVLLTGQDSELLQQGDDGVSQIQVPAESESLVELSSEDVPEEFLGESEDLEASAGAENMLSDEVENLEIKQSYVEETDAFDEETADSERAVEESVSADQDAESGEAAQLPDEFVFENDVEGQLDSTGQGTSPSEEQSLAESEDLISSRVYDDDVLENEGNDDELFVGDVEQDLVFTEDDLYPAGQDTDSFESELNHEAVADSDSDSEPVSVEEHDGFVDFESLVDEEVSVDLDNLIDLDDLQLPAEIEEELEIPEVPAPPAQLQSDSEQQEEGGEDSPVLGSFDEVLNQPEELGQSPLPGSEAIEVDVDEPDLVSEMDESLPDVNDDLAGADGGADSSLESELQGLTEGNDDADSDSQSLDFFLADETDFGVSDGSAGQMQDATPTEQMGIQLPQVNQELPQAMRDGFQEDLPAEMGEESVADGEMEESEVIEEPVLKKSFIQRLFRR